MLKSCGENQQNTGLTKSSSELMKTLKVKLTIRVQSKTNESIRTDQNNIES